MPEKKQLSSNTALLITVGVFALLYFAPIQCPRVSGAILEGFAMLQDYAREHVLLCLVPAMFIAGAITVFLNQRSVIRFLGPSTSKPLAYGVASISGAILAVCSCTVLPLFKGIYKKGAGLGPAVAFPYSGPAINILAIILSYKIFGWELGAARMIGAVIFSILIGLSMQFIFRNEDAERLANGRMFAYNPEKEPRTLGQMVTYMGTMIAILIILNWPSSQGASALWDGIHDLRFVFSGMLLVVLAAELGRWFSPDELKIWFVATRDFYVFCHPYRGTYRPGASRCRNGQGPGFGLVIGRPVPVSALHDRHRSGIGLEKNYHLRPFGSWFFYPGRLGFRESLALFQGDYFLDCPSKFHVEICIPMKPIGGRIPRQAPGIEEVTAHLSRYFCKLLS